MAAWLRLDVALAPVAVVDRAPRPTLDTRTKSLMLWHSSPTSPTSCSTPLPSSSAMRSLQPSSRSRTCNRRGAQAHSPRLGPCGLCFALGAACFCHKSHLLAVDLEHGHAEGEVGERLEALEEVDGCEHVNAALLGVAEVVPLVHHLEGGWGVKQGGK